ncbi:MAG: PD40 domain-containing protein [Anaerolineales bacterium]|nr:PD40 domain-containing protein [Anaerolineales bacterium]
MLTFAHLWRCLTTLIIALAAIKFVPTLALAQPPLTLLEDQTKPSSTTLYSPADKAINTDQAFLYVSDYNLVRMNPDGTSIAMTSFGIENAVMEKYVSLSPNGQQVAFSTAPYPNPFPYHIYTVTVDGKNLTRLTHDALRGYGPIWSPDGSRLAFIGREDGAAIDSVYGHLYVMNADGSNPLRLIPEPIVTTPPLFWLPDSQRLLFTGYQQINGQYLSDLYLVGADGSNLTRLTHDESPDIFHETLTLAPDGQAFLFIKSIGSTSDGDLYLGDVNGGDLRNLTASLDARVDYAAWSPDEQRIAITANPQDKEGKLPDGGSNMLFVVDRASASITPLAQASCAYGPVWSPNGAKIGYSSFVFCDQQVSLFTINRDGANPTRLSPAGFDGQFLAYAWSADNTELIFAATVSEREGTDLYRVQADGGNLTRLTPTSGRFQMRFVGWLPN